MAEKQEPEEKDNFIEFIKKIWSPIAGFLGAITLLINFYQLWLGNQELITRILAGVGFLFLFISLIWVGFSKKDVPKRGNRKATKSTPRYSLVYRRIARAGLAILTLVAVFGINILIQHRAEQGNKLIVLIAEFEGPEDVYGLRNEIIENLNADFSSDKNVEIISIDEIVTISKGSEYARKLGKNYLADIVIWGWYRPTENPNINIHIENLSSNQLLTLGESETFQPVTTLSELESFSFQQQTGAETSAFIWFLAGYIEYKSKNYETAIQYLDNSLATLPTSPLLFENRVEIYFYRGNLNSHLTNYEHAIQDYDQAIQIDPQLAEVYNNRGVAYADLGDYEHAIQDYDQTIQINRQLPEAYYNRGVVYSELGEYKRAIQDFDQAIQLNPQFALAYTNRGIVYGELGEYERAIQDFDQATQINPQYANAYFNRGIVYRHLGEYERAIQNFDQAIQIDSTFEDAYMYRGYSYANLKDYEHALEDLHRVIQINPQNEESYLSRGTVYVHLNELQLAIDNFSKSIEINPQLADAYMNRGTVYARLNVLQLAIQDFEQAIQINPQYAKAYYNRGLAYQALGKSAEAEADFAKYKELTGQDAP